MNVIMGTAFSITLGVWRLKFRIAIEDSSLPGGGCDEIDEN